MESLQPLSAWFDRRDPRLCTHFPVGRMVGATDQSHRWPQVHDRHWELWIGERGDRPVATAASDYRFSDSLEWVLHTVHR